MPGPHGIPIRWDKRRSSPPGVVARSAGADKSITKDVMTILNYGDESVSVAMQEVTPDEWREQEYRPDILDSAATL